VSFQQKAEERLRHVVSNAGILVLASHSRGLIERECTMILELNHGVATGDPAPLRKDKH